MGWYFHTFQRDLLHKLLGHASANQKDKFVKVLTDPDEYGDMEEEDLQRRAELATEVLEHGVSYNGKKGPEAAELDDMHNADISSSATKRWFNCTGMLEHYWKINR